MKFKIIFCITAIALVTACSKSDTKMTAPQTYAMTGTVNGAKWNAICYSESWTNYLGVPFIIIKSGDTAVYPYIRIQIPLDTELVRTMKICDFNDHDTWDRDYPTFASIDSSYTQYCGSYYGTLTITQKAPHIAGSISFTCRDSTKVNASFTCKTPQ